MPGAGPRVGERRLRGSGARRWVPGAVARGGKRWRAVAAVFARWPDPCGSGVRRWVPGAVARGGKRWRAVAAVFARWPDPCGSGVRRWVPGAVARGGKRWRAVAAVFARWPDPCGSGVRRWVPGAVARGGKRWRAVAAVFARPPETWFRGDRRTAWLGGDRWTAGAVVPWRLAACRVQWSKGRPGDVVQGRPPGAGCRGPPADRRVPDGVAYAWTARPRSAVSLLATAVVPGRR